MYLTKKTEQLLEKRLGKNIKEIRNMSLEDEIAFIEKRTGKRLMFSKKEAYQNALVLDEILCEAENSATYLKRKAMRREIASYAFGVIGVVGTVITIIGFLK